MNVETRLGLGILVAALALGAWGDALLRETPWGLNTLLWMAALVVVVIVLAGRQRIFLTGGGRWLVAPLLLFAAAFSWRDSPTLKALDGAALLLLLSLAALRSRYGQLRFAGVTEYLLCTLIAGLNALVGPVLLLCRDVQWKSVTDSRAMRYSPAIARGLLIAVPLLLVFGGLFMAADATFERLIVRVFNLDAQSLATHLLVTGGCAWLVGGLLRATLLREEAIGPNLPRPQRISLSIVEIGMVMGLLDLLFLSFVCVQMRYFFGGQAHVLATAGLTSADYARRGFFELVTVATLALPMLLLADWLLRKESAKIERLFTLLAGGMTLLLFVIMASAVQRMHLYHIGYGLTELRVYTTAFMGWLASVFLWLCATVLRGQRERFAFGAFVAFLLTIGVLHALNPDALIVRANVGVTLSHHDRRYDSGYAASLSADAVPSLVSVLPSLSAPDRREVAARLLQSWSPPKRADWRSWSLARVQAWQAVQENQALLREMASAPQTDVPPGKAPSVETRERGAERN